MLHHISVAVNNPLHVAEVLTEVLGGRSFPFPPHPGSYIVLMGDEHGTAIELYPTGTELLPGYTAVAFAHSAMAPQYTAIHAALSVPVSQEQIEAIGRREGWQVRLCDRGPFKVVEFWVENQLMLELMPPSIVPLYTEFMKPQNWEAFLAMAESLELAERHRATSEPVSV